MPTNPPTQQQLEDAFAAWITAAAGIPAVFEEQPDETGASSALYATAATTGSDTTAGIVFLAGPLPLGYAQHGPTDANGIRKWKANRQITISLKIRGPDAVRAMGAVFQSLEDETGRALLESDRYGNFVIRRREGPRHLQSPLESGYVTVQQADLTFAYQETWTQAAGAIESIEGDADLASSGETFTVTYHAEAAEE
jgi:hypothetical protein